MRADDLQTPLRHAWSAIRRQGKNASAADQPRLAFAEGIADRNGIFGHPVAAELIGQVGHIMDIELRLDEKGRLDVKLDADAAVQLKVIGVQASGIAECRGDAGDRNGLRLIESNSSAADATIYHRNDALAGNRLVHSVEI